MPFPNIGAINIYKSVKSQLQIGEITNQKSVKSKELYRKTFPAAAGAGGVGVVEVKAFAV